MYLDFKKNYIPQRWDNEAMFAFFLVSFNILKTSILKTSRGGGIKVWRHFLSDVLQCGVRGPSLFLSPDYNLLLHSTRSSLENSKKN